MTRRILTRLLENRNIVDILGFNPAILGIYHKEVLKMIQQDEAGWEEKVPPQVARLIKEKRLFGDWFISDWFIGDL